MSDNVSKLPTEHKALLRRLVIFLVIVLVITAAAALYAFRDSPALKGLFSGGREAALQKSFTFDGHASNRYEAVNGGFAVASVTGTAVYDADGDQVTLLQRPMTTPALQVGGQCVLSYDVAGQTLQTVHQTKGEVFHLDAPRPILDADISGGDWLCYSTQETGYKSVLYVCNPQGQTTYSWLSSSQYLPLCAVSQDGTFLAAAALGQENGIYRSALVVFRTDSTEIYSSFSLGNELVYDLKFYGDDLVCVIGESSTMFVRLDGTLAGRYPYEGAYLKDFDFGGNGFLTLSLNMYRAGNRSTIASVSKNGGVFGTAAIEEELLDVSAAGKYVAVLTTSSLTIFDQSMKQVSRTINDTVATAVLMRADGTALLFADGHGTVYTPGQEKTDET